MRRNAKQSSQRSLRTLLGLSGLGLLLLPLSLTSCGGSAQEEDQRLLPGSHSLRAMEPGDYLVEKGTSLSLGSAKKSRFFIAKGAALRIESSRSCTFYAEPGAQLLLQPEATILPVEDASKQYRLRHTLKAAGEFEPEAEGLTGMLNPFAWLGGLTFGQGDDTDDAKPNRRRSQPQSVKPSSYRSGS